MLKPEHLGGGLLALLASLQACAAPPPEQIAHPSALDRSAVWINPDGSAGGTKSPATELGPGPAAPLQNEAGEDEPANPTPETEKGGLGGLDAMGFEPTPLPGGGGNPGYGGYSGGDHTGEPGDAFGHGFCDDPQYAGFCRSRAVSGAPPPGAAHRHPRGRAPSGEAYYPPGPSEAAIADAKQAWKDIEQRGNDLLKRYRGMYEDESEATGKACVQSCTGSVGALCGPVESICSTGNTKIPLFPGMPIPCGAAKAASCEGNPNECILGCFIVSVSASAAGRPLGGEPGAAARLSPRAREGCRYACKMAEGLSCVAVAGLCVPGTVWTFGGVSIPCYYAILAGCAGAITAGTACSAWCDGG